MLTLTMKGIENQAPWKEAGYAMPAFDVEQVQKRTRENPTWVHFGAGNIFRGFLAPVMQTLLDKGAANTGVIAAETYDEEIIEKVYRPHDNLAVLVSLLADGQMKKTVIASIAQAVRADGAVAEEATRLREIFCNKSLQMASFTITEKGYSLRGMDGEFSQLAKADFAAGPDQCRHAMAVVASLMYRRYLAGRHPMALVSMDNCSHNGEKLQQAIWEMAQQWRNHGFVEDGFIDYLHDAKAVSFPWTMIDKITPRPSDEVMKKLQEDALADMQPIATAKHTYIAPFTNAEVPQYLVIEDDFPAGRPKLEQAGVYMTTRDKVSKSERMKVTTCLNPLHTAISGFGCVLRVPTIAACMKDNELSQLAKRVGFDEGLPVVVDPEIFSPEVFLREVLYERLPNPFIPDAPQRIVCDNSQKVPIRFGQTILSYMQRPDLDPETLTYIPLALAGWLRMLIAVDDEGNEIPLSADPMLDQLTAAVAGITIDKPLTQEQKASVEALLTNERLFGVDLRKARLDQKVLSMFQELCNGKGAVRKTLKKYID